MSKEKSKEDFSELQSSVAVAFAGKGGVFEKAIELAIKGWKVKNAFAVLDLGCSNGRNQIPLISMVKKMVREKKKDAKIVVIQMDYEKGKGDELSKNAAKWLDSHTESFYVAQSFFDKYDFSKSERTDGKKGGIDKNLELNLIFSQSALHWVKDMQPLSMEHMKSSKTREYSKKSMSFIFDHMEAKLAIGGVVAANCIGIINDEGWSIFGHVISSYSQTFQAVLNEDDCKKMLSAFLPQVPRRMEDLEGNIKSRKYMKWVDGGKMFVPKGLTGKKAEEVIPMYARGMMSPKMWKDRFVELFPKRKEEMESVFKKAEEEMAKVLKKIGLMDFPFLMYFILTKTGSSE